MKLQVVWHSYMFNYMSLYQHISKKISTAMHIYIDAYSIYSNKALCPKARVNNTENMRSEVWQPSSAMWLSSLVTGPGEWKGNWGHWWRETDPSNKTTAGTLNQTRNHFVNYGALITLKSINYEANLQFSFFYIEI